MLNKRQKDTRHPYIFLLILFIVSLPLYALNEIIHIKGPFGLPPSVIMIFAPTIIAAILLYKVGGFSEVKQWIKKAFAMPNSSGYKLLPIAALFAPISALGAYAIVSSQAAVPSLAGMSIGLVLLTLVVYWLGAIFEELGWTTYLTPILQKKHGVLVAGIIIGTAWGLWHVIPYLQMGYSVEWIIYQVIATIASRVFLGYMFSASQATVLAITHHTVSNLMSEIVPYPESLVLMKASAVATIVLTIGASIFFTYYRTRSLRVR